ncbi:hypothetical protein AKN87_07670 [Thiopseudomonas alkaliphila]|uniref:Uncharacterized protein n=1 Tax=Thiopseudomonas alkaliphila TaxID=1697053 RepID=A0A0K1XDK1_9GAMM|nr:hypothetical protein [Thiopseudomonas alkaliphila]AKX44983.1 hypothetical protein AKN87_07670 [Thiopseudomonas alkaliphila]AKX47501.1 hypothetical protein AKN94_09160 [Thiopseudomonas alkaliphila]AKX48292.1 hypothetical protein AKN93_01850 [Thiopseudomonas alkaliphila]AKX51286.1 hypothetical protein AKN92_07100 [Thiopseudomonas alkaliphila]AKX53421.1 hypothetical protein AKN91_06865 [Thiopseudomonas alkaliphila]
MIKDINYMVSGGYPVFGFFQGLLVLLFLAAIVYGLKKLALKQQAKVAATEGAELPKSHFWVKATQKALMALIFLGVILYPLSVFYSGSTYNSFKGSIQEAFNVSYQDGYLIIKNDSGQDITFNSDLKGHLVADVGGVAYTTKITVKGDLVADGRFDQQVKGKKSKVDIYAEDPTLQAAPKKKPAVKKQDLLIQLADQEIYVAEINARNDSLKTVIDQLDIYIHRPAR